MIRDRLTITEDPSQKIEIKRYDNGYAICTTRHSNGNKQIKVSLLSSQEMETVISFVRSHTDSGRICS